MLDAVCMPGADCMQGVDCMLGANCMPGADCMRVSMHTIAPFFFSDLASWLPCSVLPVDALPNLLPETASLPGVRRDEVGMGMGMGMGMG